MLGEPRAAPGAGQQRGDPRSASVVRVVWLLLVTASRRAECNAEMRVCTQQCECRAVRSRGWMDGRSKKTVAVASG
jgi:hypothetical protein